MIFFLILKLHPLLNHHPTNYYCFFLMLKNLFQQILNAFLQIIIQKVINFLIFFNFMFLNFFQLIINFNFIFNLTIINY